MLTRVFNPAALGLTANRLVGFDGTTLVSLRQALEEVGRFLMRKSQELVPVDTGALRNSAFTVVE